MKRENYCLINSQSLVYLFQIDLDDTIEPMKLLHFFENQMQNVVENKFITNIKHDGDSRIHFFNKTNSLIQLDLFDFLN